MRRARCVCCYPRVALTDKLPRGNITTFSAITCCKRGVRLWVSNKESLVGTYSRNMQIFHLPVERPREGVPLRGTWILQYLQIPKVSWFGRQPVHCLRRVQYLVKFTGEYFTGQYSTWQWHVPDTFLFWIRMAYRICRYGRSVPAGLHVLCLWLLSACRPRDGDKTTVQTTMHRNNETRDTMNGSCVIQCLASCAREAPKTGIKGRDFIRRSVLVRSTVFHIAQRKSALCSLQSVFLFCRRFAVVIPLPWGLNDEVPDYAPLSSRSVCPLRTHG